MVQKTPSRRDFSTPRWQVWRREGENPVVPHVFLRWCLLFCLVAGAAAARADDLVAERGWFEDSSGSLTLEEVQRAAFQPFEGDLSRGFGDAPVWVRLRIDPARAAPGAPGGGDQMVLRVLSSLFLEVQLHDPLRSGAPLRTGLLADPSVEPSSSRYPSFVLPRGDAPRDVWLRLRTHHTRYTGIEVLPVVEWAARQAAEARRSTLLLASLALMLLWALASSMMKRDRILLLFAMYLTGFIGYAGITLGEHRTLLPAGSLSWLADPLVDATILLGSGLLALFLHALLREYRPPRVLMRALLACAASFPLLWFLARAGQAELAFRSYNILIAFGSALPPLCALTSRPPQGTDAPVIPVGWLAALLLLSFLVVALNALNVLGLTSGLLAGRSFAVANGPLVGTLLVVYLWIRGRRQDALARRVQVDLEATRKDWERERRSREEREELLAMLTHEIRTPLSILKINVGQALPALPATRRAMDDIEGLMDRCVQLGLLEGKEITPRWSHCELGEVLAQVAEQLPGSLPIDWSAAHSSALHTDRRLLEIILRNLLENAVKYAKPGTMIHVASGPQARGAQEGVEIRVANEPGDAGWPAADRLFSKYYRSPGARRSSGSGLGLYLGAGLLRMLGGSVEYRPTATHVQFVAWLPAVAPGAGE